MRSATRRPPSRTPRRTPRERSLLEPPDCSPVAVESSLRGQVEQRIHGESATDGLGTTDQRSDEPPQEPRGLCGFRASQERADGAGHLGRAGATDAACPITIWIPLKMTFMDSQVARDLESPQPSSLRSCAPRSSRPWCPRITRRNASTPSRSCLELPRALAWCQDDPGDLLQMGIPGSPVFANRHRSSSGLSAPLSPARKRLSSEALGAWRSRVSR